MRPQGYSLAAVSALIAVAFFLLLLALDVMIQTYRRGAQAENYEIALRYADAGFQRALVNLRENADWGKQASDAVSLTGLAEDGPGTGGLVRFTTSPSNTDNTLSLNRVGLGTISLASGLIVPANSVHLVSLGTHRGVHATVEGVVAVNPFPFALASTGPLISTGAFLVGSVEDASALDDPLALQKALKRGSLLSNATGNSVSLSGSPIRVTGDVVCAGRADLASGVTVEGVVKENRQPKPIPDLKLPDFDTASKVGVRNLESNHLTQPEAFEGYVHGTGDVLVDGALKLSEAIVYIDGSLTVRGALSGRGALFVTGPVRLESSSLGALSELAIVSGGSLSISGRDQKASRIAGLLVSKGNLSLSDVTVVGCVICAGGPERVLRLHNVDAFASPKGTKFEFALGWGGVSTSYPLPPDPTMPGGGGTVRLHKIPDASDPTGERLPLPADFVGRYDSANPNADLLKPGDFEVVELDAHGRPVIGPDGKEVVRSFTDSGLRFDDEQLDRNMLDALQQTSRDQAQAPAAGGVSQGQLSLDLNRFLKVGETLQVVYRRIH